MKALSVRAPWWWYILYGGKDVENRNWSTSVRGVVGVHASKTMPQGETRADMAEAARLCGLGRAGGFGLAAQPTFSELAERAGCLVGTVEVVDCVTRSASPWFMGRYGFVLRNPVVFREPVACKGALGWFEVPAEVLERGGVGRVRAEGNLRLF